MLLLLLTNYHSATVSHSTTYYSTIDYYYVRLRRTTFTATGIIVPTKPSPAPFSPVYVRQLCARTIMLSLRSFLQSFGVFVKQQPDMHDQSGSPSDPGDLQHRLQQDKLSNPDNFPGYLLFISATPPEGEVVDHNRLSDFYPYKSLRSWEENTSTKHAPFERSTRKLIYYIAFRYDMTVEGSHVVSSYDQSRWLVAF